MREPVLENEEALNRAAKKALMSMKVVPSPDVLYCLQLAKWTSKHPSVEVKPPALLENLDVILYQVNPKNVMSFLLDAYDLISDLKGKREPLEIGVAILNQLGKRLGEIQDLCEEYKPECPAIPRGRPIYPLSRMLLW